MNEHIKFVFFGGEPLAVPTLEKLKERGLSPALIICNPDRPSGRGQKLTSPPTKIWAEIHNIPVFQPTTYKDDITHLRLGAEKWDLFVVVAYNFILPNWILTLPKHGAINIHPSLLPKLRGASPIRSAILEDRRDDIGVSIIQIDNEMDHGPILRQEKVTIKQSDWPINGPELDSILATLGGELLAETIPAWVAGKITPQEQNHEAATYCRKLQKDDAELKLDPLALPAGKAGRQILLTIKAFAGIGDTFFIHKGKRVKIKDAEFSEGKLRILKVTPEGKNETDFTAYLRTIS